MFFVHNKTLNDLLSFSIYLIDDSNNELTFPPDEKKTIILNFKIHVFLRWIGDWDRPDCLNKLKKNKLFFLLEDVEKNLEEYKKAIELRDKQLPDIKKNLQGAKKGYDNVIKENT